MEQVNRIPHPDVRNGRITFGLFLPLLLARVHLSFCEGFECVLTRTLLFSSQALATVDFEVV